jgi:hypothetical protein
MKCKGKILHQAQEHSERKPWKILSYMVRNERAAIANPDLMNRGSDFREAINLI